VRDIGIYCSELKRHFLQLVVNCIELNVHTCSTVATTVVNVLDGLLQISIICLVGGTGGCIRSFACCSMAGEISMVAHLEMTVLSCMNMTFLPRVKLRIITVPFNFDSWSLVTVALIQPVRSARAAYILESSLMQTTFTLIGVVICWDIDGRIDWSSLIVNIFLETISYKNF